MITLENLRRQRAELIHRAEQTLAWYNQARGALVFVEGQIRTMEEGAEPEAKPNGVDHVGEGHA